MIHASVNEIGEGAFYKCRDLKCITFILGSRLEKIGWTCFGNAGIERIVIPKSVT